MWSNYAVSVEIQRLIDKLDLPPMAAFMWRTNMNYRIGGAMCLGCTRYLPPNSDHECREDGVYYTITYTGGAYG